MNKPRSREEIEAAAAHLKEALSAPIANTDRGMIPRQVAMAAVATALEWAAGEDNSFEQLCDLMRGVDRARKAMDN